MNSIFIPMFGRVNTNNRDGGEIRINKLLNFLLDNFKVYIYCTFRQISVSMDQGTDLSKFNTKFFDDITDSQSDGVINLLLVYFYRLYKCILNIYPSNITNIYIPSDFFFDVLPAYLCWKKNSKASVQMCCFLICPNPFRKFKNKNNNIYSFPSIRQTIYFISQRLSFILLRKMKGTILVLNSSDKFFIKNLSIDCKITTMGIDIFQYESIECQNKIYDAVFVGRFHEQKGIERLLYSWKIVNDKEPRLLCIVGGGSIAYLNSIKQIINSLNLNNSVKILGFLDGSEKIRIMKSSRICVIPSIYESYGTIVLEAGACDLPVVAFAIPIFKNLFNEYLLFAEDDNLIEYADNIINSLTTDQTLRINRFKTHCISLDWKLVFKNELESFNA